MTVLPVITVGDPVLRERAQEVTPEQLRSPEVQRLIDDMIETMRAAGGAGIAANQVGSLLRIAVVEVDDNPRYPYKPRVPLTVMVNPMIEPLDDEDPQQLADLVGGDAGAPGRAHRVDHVVDQPLGLGGAQLLERDLAGALAQDGVADGHDRQDGHWGLPPCQTAAVRCTPGR